MSSLLEILTNMNNIINFKSVKTNSGVQQHQHWRPPFTKWNSWLSLAQTNYVGLFEGGRETQLFWWGHGNRRELKMHNGILYGIVRFELVWKSMLLHTPHLILWNNTIFTIFTFHRFIWFTDDALIQGPSCCFP